MNDQRDNVKAYFSLAFPILLVGVLAAPVAAIFWLNADWVPASVTSQLRDATESEVHALLGEPQHVTERTWAFSRSDRFAEFQVHFSEDRRVDGFHYDR